MLLVDAVAAAQIGMHHVALDRPRPHDRDLDDEVVESARLQARQHRHLRAALDLEHADRIGARQHVVDRRVLRRQRGERIVLAVVLLQEIEPARMQLSMPSASTSTFIMPSVSMSSLSHSMKVRSSIAALPIGTVSSSGARVSTKPPTCCERWRGKPISSSARSDGLADRRIVGIEPGLADVIVGQAVAIAPHRPGERGGDVLGQAQHLADFADGAAGAVMHDGRADRRAVAAVALVDVLDHLLAPLVLEIDVDVGRLAAVVRDEALEQEVGLVRDRPR